MTRPMRVTLRCRNGALRNAVIVACALLAAGCASFTADGGMTTVADISTGALNKEVMALRTGEDATAAQAIVKRLLKRPLGADAAVQVALLNNRKLQAAYNELALAEAARVGASLPPNPVLSIDDAAGGGGLDIERRITADLLALATLPARSDLASDRFHEAQLRAAAATVIAAVETRRAYYDAVASRARVHFLVEAQSTAQAAAQLARHLGETGALNKLDQARDQVFYAELTAQLAAARERAVSTREHLTRLLGLWGSDVDFRLPEMLPPLPRRPRTLPMIEIEAVRDRIDLQAGRLEVRRLAKAYGLTKATRFINLLDVAGISETQREPGSPSFNEFGAGIEFEVPLFDFGEVRVRAAEATYLKAVNRLIAAAVNVRSEARQAYQAYRSAYDIGRHYQREVLPLRKIIADETLLRYNAMQIDVFSLLSETRQRIASTTAAIEAERKFWLADASLTAAMIGGGAPDADAAESFMSVTASAEASGSHD